MTTTVGAGPELGFAEGGDPAVGYLSEVLTALGGLAGGTGRVADAARIDRIAVLERVKAAAAAAQAAEIVQFARSQVAAQREARVDYRRLGRGIAEQIGLATRLSPWHGARKCSLARDLTTDRQPSGCSPKVRSVKMRRSWSRPKPPISTLTSGGGSTPS